MSTGLPGKERDTGKCLPLLEGNPLGSLPTLPVKKLLPTANPNLPQHTLTLRPPVLPQPNAAVPRRSVPTCQVGGELPGPAAHGEADAGSPCGLPGPAGGLQHGAAGRLSPPPQAHHGRRLRGRPEHAGHAAAQEAARWALHQRRQADGGGGLAGTCGDRRHQWPVHRPEPPCRFPSHRCPLLCPLYPPKPRSAAPSLPAPPLRRIPPAPPARQPPPRRGTTAPVLPRAPPGRAGPRTTFPVVPRGRVLSVPRGGAVGGAASGEARRGGGGGAAGPGVPGASLAVMSALEKQLHLGRLPPRTPLPGGGGHSGSKMRMG